MIEDEARAWLKSNHDVSRETWNKLEEFVGLLLDEMSRQNLISKASAEHIWSRHIVDSAQLLLFAPQKRSLWLDLGTGAGFPGMVAAILSNHDVQMVESRARRVEFLNRVIEKLNLQGRASVHGSRLEKIASISTDIISARAFAPLDQLIALSHRFSTEKTVWLLPKGKNAVRELNALPPKQQKLFHVEQSLTNPEAGILVGKGKIT
ncbi:MAG: 16S rRNA (guanine(527)-N(7))-methyltransferase RsmG [Parasphingorhabdus sp.]